MDLQIRPAPGDIGALAHAGRHPEVVSAPAAIPLSTSVVSAYRRTGPT